jgi:GxxExxY protein
VVEEPLVRSVIGCAIEVHRALGPGLLESAYTRCLSAELRANGIGHRAEVVLPLRYRDLYIGVAYRIDILVEDWLILEVKCVEKLLPIHQAQVITYLKLAGARQGLLFNFRSVRLKDGMRSLLVPATHLNPDGNVAAP